MTLKDMDELIRLSVLALDTTNETQANELRVVQKTIRELADWLDQYTCAMEEQ
jgi:hypothetical protein